MADIPELLFGLANRNVAEFRADGDFEHAVGIPWRLYEGMLPSAFDSRFGGVFRQQSLVTDSPFAQKRYLLFQSFTGSTGCPIFRSIMAQSEL